MADGMNEAASPILHEASGRSGSVSVAEAEVFAGLRGLRVSPRPTSPGHPPPPRGQKRRQPAEITPAKPGNPHIRHCEVMECTATPSSHRSGVPYHHSRCRCRARELSGSPLCCDSALLSQYSTFGLHCRVWGVDWQSRQGYKVSVLMAPCER